MPDISISAETYKDLEELVIGFDTPENVIKRLVKEHKQKAKPLETKPAQVSNTPQRVETTPEMLRETYRLAKDVVEWRKELDDALDYLEEKVGMNRTSAHIFIKVFKAMRAGEHYTRTISLPSTHYFLEQILSDYGKDGLRMALNALRKHIEYYENGPGKQSTDSIREMLEEFSAKLQRASRKAITMVEIREIYKKAKEVFEAREKDIYQGREALDNALDYLENDIGMNRGSAHIYIKVFLAMKEGGAHKNKMSINDSATDYFLEQIYQDDGKEGLKLALNTLWKYVEYREEDLKGGTMKKTREILKRHEVMLVQ